MGHPVPHSGAYNDYHRSRLGRLGDRDASWDNQVCIRPATPTERRLHPSPPGTYLGRFGIGTLRGTIGIHKVKHCSHSGGYTRVPPVLPGLLWG